MIKKIKWNCHPILGNLELDFTKSDGGIYNTVIFAGENGAGKTTILDSLSTFLNLGSFEDFEYITYDIGGVTYTIRPTTNSKFGFHIRKKETDGTERTITSGKNNSRATIDDDSEDIRHYGCSYSKARSGFNTKKVTSSTTMQLDMDRHEEDVKDDFTSIKQLFVDIDDQDKSAWMEISQTQPNPSFDAFRIGAKKYRFEKAFNDFFNSLKFKKVDPTYPDEKKIVFEKNGKEIFIDSLSTGEKQIVFRGAHLLKNSSNLSGGVVLIDEPELSMHPKWQEKILKYYRDLYNSGGVQTTQMLFATHSEYVLRAALTPPNNNDILIVVLKDNSGVVEAQRIIAPSILPSITSAEINYIAFDVVSNDYHIQLYGYLQNKTGNTSVKRTDDYIIAQTQYNSAIHRKLYTHGTTTYQSLATYIRNVIDHPDSTHSFTQEELRVSIELLIDLCR